MVWDPKPTMKALQSVLADTGYFEGGVLIGDVFSPPGHFTAALMAMDLLPSQTSLSGTIDVFTVRCRMYIPAGMTVADAETVELKAISAPLQVMAALAGKFTLAGTVRAIDWAGEESSNHYEVKWGHLQFGGTIFRMADLDLPLIIDDNGLFAP